MLREKAYVEARGQIRRALAESGVTMTAGQMMKITDRVSEVMAGAVDQEVEGIVDASGIIPSDEFGGFFTG